MEPQTAAPQADSDVLISKVVSNIGHDFVRLADALRNEQDFSVQVPASRIDDEFSRFKLWAGNIAAHRKGRRSLEYRLRDAAHLKTATIRSLGELADTLRNALDIVRGTKTPWELFSDSDSDSSSVASSVGELQGDTELKQLLELTKTVITSLFRLSVAIRAPAPNNQSKSPLIVDKSFYVPHDIQHVQEKFPTCPEYLIERLGRAISGRRQYLSYRETHQQKLAKSIEKIGSEKPITEFTTNSTEATPLPVIERTNSLNIVDEGDDDAASQTSYATSVNAAIKIPVLPKAARGGDYFECPLCFLLVSINSRAEWKNHVYRDLHPYCCTHEHCTSADRLYDSRRSWFAHELQAHRTSWQCVEGCGKTFHSENEFEQHAQQSHPELANHSMLSALKLTSAKSASLSEQVACALCEKKMSLRALHKHLGGHQQQLALFALPPNLEDAEDEASDASEDVPDPIADLGGSQDGVDSVRDDDDGSSESNDGHEDERILQEEIEAFQERQSPAQSESNNAILPNSADHNPLEQARNESRRRTQDDNTDSDDMPDLIISDS
ncbi:hypothetical protein IQ07DRAFT_499938 [Pyrenochaeta sp. DS3sAY3a]|nr:hypothetical protein IQ07DRAFT_499938 [Pyrenochaeta sp. DS3sAY3a]